MQLINTADREEMHQLLIGTKKKKKVVEEEEDSGGEGGRENKAHA